MKAYTYITTNPDKYQALLLKEHFGATVIKKEFGVQYMVIFAPLDQKQKATLLSKEKI